jgi:hypothetical protein
MKDAMREMIENEAAENTDVELWREVDGDYYAPSVHVTKDGGIGINVGGKVYVKPLREWHNLADQNPNGFAVSNPEAYERQATAESGSVEARVRELEALLGRVVEFMQRIPFSETGSILYNDIKNTLTPHQAKEGE